MTQKEAEKIVEPLVQIVAGAAKIHDTYWIVSAVDNDGNDVLVEVMLSLASGKAVIKTRFFYAK